MTLVPDYPPPHHLLRDLRFEVEHRRDGTSVAWLPVVPELLDDHGGVRTGVLATLVDVIGGGLAAHTARPNWIATADLTLHLVADAFDGMVRAEACVVRAGRTTVVLEVGLHDETAGSDTALGVATMTFSVLPRRDDNPVITDERGEPPRASLALPDSHFAEPFSDAVGLRVTELPGVVELDPADYIRNSLGAVQGGVMATLVEAAGRESVRAATGVPVVTRDLQVTYLALGRIGPVRATADVLGASSGAPAHGCARVDVVDHGNDDRRTTVGRVVACAPEAAR